MKNLMKNLEDVNRMFAIEMKKQIMARSMANLELIFYDIGELIHEGSDCNYMATLSAK